MTLHLASVRNLVGPKNPTLLQQIVYEISYDAVHKGEPCCQVRGWYVDRITGKRVEASPQYIGRYADKFTMQSARYRIAEELGAM